ncbi:hypothetical protein CHISP_0032 [Chitinispirillum alkaliphilum]|nr:hypothetical protein CHISP_0032 [Chitinispirillum alkaliphilum]
MEKDINNGGLVSLFTTCSTGVNRINAGGEEADYSQVMSNSGYLFLECLCVLQLFNQRVANFFSAFSSIFLENGLCSL